MIKTYKRKPGQRGVTIVEVLIGALIVLLVLAVFFAAAIKPYFEAKSFNDCTGSHATYWDAVFTELRIERCHQ